SWFCGIYALHVDPASIGHFPIKYVACFMFYYAMLSFFMLIWYTLSGLAALLVGHYVLQGARPALSGGLGGGALWDEDTFVISLEEGHYAAYIKMMALKEEEEALILSDVTDLPTHHLCCFAIFGIHLFEDEIGSSKFSVIIEIFFYVCSTCVIHLCNFIIFMYKFIFSEKLGTNKRDTKSATIMAHI
ncbi:hypothetical protein ACJX0J_020396, partial [Zea mays]